jgi:hypothetical protein
MNDKIHKWLDQRELLRFGLTMLVAMFFSTMISSIVLKHHPMVSAAGVLTVAFIMASRWLYLRKHGAL